MLPPVLAVALAAVVAAPSSMTPRLTVQLIRRCPPVAACTPSDVVLEMKRETERIWSSFGVHLAWIESLSGEPLPRPVPDLVVMFEEHPHPVVPDSDRRELVLGRLSPPDGVCDAGVAHLWVTHVRRHIETVHVNGVQLISVPARLAQLLLALALGRTLAHEIGHYLLGPAHAPHGLMRAHFNADELIERRTLGQYDLDDASRRMLTARQLRRTAQHCVIPEGRARGASQP